MAISLLVTKSSTGSENPVNVTYVSPVEPNPDSYRVTFSDGSYVDCDAEHNWYTETLNEREQRKLGSVRTTAEIRDTLISNRSTKAKNHAVPTTKPLNLPHAELPIDPYTLGVWLGDGSSDSGSVSNAFKDKQIIREIASTGWTVGCVRRLLKKTVHARCMACWVFKSVFVRITC